MTVQSISRVRLEAQRPPSLYKRALAFALICATPLGGCSTLTKSDLAKRQDYMLSSEHAARGDAAGALRAMPDKETGGFITTMERGLLGVFSGKPETAAMVRVGRDLEATKTLSLSREAVAYFYKETEEGYFPAEHEAIAFHIVNGMAFLQTGRPADAKIEARRAARYLQTDFGAAVGFDDPALRVWLAALWAATGEWESARVDLRAAAKLDARLTWAAKLAERPSPPKHLALVLSGPGPDVVWRPTMGAVQNVAFGRGSDDEPVRADGFSIFPSLATIRWYDRHQERDHAIRDVLSSSRYMVESAPSAVAAGAVATTGTVVGASLIIVGVATGVAIFAGSIYLAAIAHLDGQAGAYLIGGGGLLGLLVAGKMTRAGTTVVDKSIDASSGIVESGMSPIDTYRFVRFLPDHIRLATSDGETAPVQIGDPPRSPQPFLSVAAADTNVRFFFTPGAATPATSQVDDATARAAQISRALSRRWMDEAHNRGWLFSSSPVEYAQAVAVCETASAGQDIWQIPTWIEWQEGRQAGLAVSGRNRIFGSRLLDAKEVWGKRSSFDQVRHQCRVIDIKTGEERVIRDCATPRPILCTAEVRG